MYDVTAIKRRVRADSTKHGGITPCLDFSAALTLQTREVIIFTIRFTKSVQSVHRVSVCMVR
jgi:hypothetical protein